MKEAAACNNPTFDFRREAEMEAREALGSSLESEKVHAWLCGRQRKQCLCGGEYGGIRPHDRRNNNMRIIKNGYRLLMRSVWPSQRLSFIDKQQSAQLNRVSRTTVTMAWTGNGPFLDWRDGSRVHRLFSPLHRCFYFEGGISSGLIASQPLWRDGHGLEFLLGSCCVLATSQGGKVDTRGEELMTI